MCSWQGSTAADAHGFGRAARAALAQVQAAKATWTRADYLKYLGLCMPPESRAMDPDAAATRTERLGRRARNRGGLLMAAERSQDTQSPVARSTTATYHAPALYTAAEAAEILRVKQSWLERQAAARKVPFTMLGGAYRFSADHLTAIVRIFEMMPSPSGGARDGRSRSPRIRKSVQANGSGITPLRPRPRTRRHDSGITGPSAA
jgi:excisionase family DNA binding protein